MPHRSAAHQYRNFYTPASAVGRAGQVSSDVVARLGDFTFAHAGHQVRIKPVAFWIVVGTLVIMAAWSITTATYFAFREDVLTRLVSREADMQFGYEDRIAELRAQIDRLSSRQLLDQEQYERKLDALLHRQAALESRANALGTITDPASTGAIKPAGRGTPAGPRSVPLKSSQLDDGESTPTRESRREDITSSTSNSQDVETRLAGVQASLDQIETRQRTQLNSLAESYDARLKRLRGALADLGLDARKLDATKLTPPPKGGMGGPFEPVPASEDIGGFDRTLTRIAVARAQVELLDRTLVNVPVHRPLAGDIEILSGFGVRIDPFLNRPAMHTGLDIRAEVGDPIRATANGVVAIAGWSGGYGKMVEINHGNGFATRFGHMSEIDVTVGEQVKSGQVIGRVGTTGRSTGPHLHYETRIDGEPVDPQRFLSAGAKLAEAQ